MHPEELWTGSSFKARVLRGLLIPASWLYGLGWQIYLWMYRLGVKKPHEPHAPVVCIGNLQVGGTGKTPMTVHVAGVLRELGHSVVVSCSGYGSPASEAAQVAPEGRLDARRWGDEAALLRDLMPDVPLIVGRRRVLAAELSHRHFPESVLLMDDGFQHLPLRKHLTILLDPPAANRHCLPAGPYREPWGNRGRADLVIPAGVAGGGAEPPHPVQTRLGSSSPTPPPEGRGDAGAGGGADPPHPVQTLLGSSSPTSPSEGRGDAGAGGGADPPHPVQTRLGSSSPTCAPLATPEGRGDAGAGGGADPPHPVRTRLGSSSPTSPSEGKGGIGVVALATRFVGPSGLERGLDGAVGVLCALGRPQGFLDTLRREGVAIGKLVLRPDHDPLTEGNLLSDFPSDRPIVVTGKDWVKLRERDDVNRYDIVIAQHAITVEPADWFRTWLKAKIDGIANKKA